MPYGNPRFQQWVNALGIEMSLEERREKGKFYYYVCFEHFNPNDHVDENGKVISVRKDSIPENID